jgi:1-acyl-sn-glycerol-3-phosphate acyltransferase
MNNLLGARIINFFLRTIIRILCKVDGDFSKVPQLGPFLLAVNHINFMDAPLIASHLHNHPLTVLAKEETWDNPILGMLFSAWGAIPIKRGEVDREAFSAALAALKGGKILAIAPEGTRSGSGLLKKGYPGIVIIAQKASVPIYPIAIYGGENFWKNIRNFKKTTIHFSMGEPFYIKTDLDATSREGRQETVDEIMKQIARLLPREYHGYYTDAVSKTPKHLIFGLQKQTQAQR